MVQPLRKSDDLFPSDPANDEDSTSEAATFLTQQSAESALVTIEIPQEAAEALGKEGLFLALLVTMDWGVAKIADVIGCNRKTPYKWHTVRNAIKARKQGRDGLPRGSKNNGDLEAWDV